MNNRSNKGKSYDYEDFLKKYIGKLPDRNVVDNNSIINNLKNHGFAINQKNQNRLFVFYDSEIAHRPMFITSDFIFYFLTQIFDSILIEIERDFLIPCFKKFTLHLQQSLLNLYDSTLPESLQKLLRENIALLTVVCRLQNPEFSIPMMVETLVSHELTNISQKKPAPSEIFQFEEDFTLYKVRGHYTQTPDFQNYFKAMLYIQRMLFMFQGKNVDEQKKQVLTHKAFLLLLSFEEEEIYSLWNQIDAFLEFWVGHTDDLTVNEYLNVWKQCGMPNPLEFSSQNFWDLVKNKLAALRDPLIYSRIYKPPIHNDPKFKGLRIFGQKYLVDSFIFQQVTHPNVDGRYFPSALDWMSFFGSQRALACLKSDGQINNQYINQFQDLQPLIQSCFNNPFEKQQSNTKFYKRFHKTKHIYYSDKHNPKRIQRLKFTTNPPIDESLNEKQIQKSFISINCDSVYAYLLYCVKGFWENLPENLPQFMESPLWDLKTLQTAASTWAQARHSMVLYAKSSIVCAGMGGLNSYGYIEPQPEVYGRIINYISFLSDQMSFFFREFIPSSKIGKVLSQTQSLFHTVLLISKKELENQVILPSDASFIRSFWKKTNEILKLFKPTTRHYNIREDFDSKIVDVHTEYFSQKCLEVGIGHAKEIIVIVPNHVGELRFTYGAVFPYYEFVQPIAQRLSDSEWQEKESSLSIPVPKWLQPLYLEDLDEIHENNIKKIKR